MRQSPIYLLFAVVFQMLSFAAFSQDTTIHYRTDSSDFANPERGFYLPLQANASHFKPLELTALNNMFAGPAKHGSATYAVYSTLLLREYVLDTFTDKPLSEEFLQLVDEDLRTVKSAGIKVILRFSYINKTHKGDCPDKEGICPPYGDAPKEIVLKHIQQLKPLLSKNVSVIALLQEGFIGIWGENYYTDYFGDASANGKGHMFDEDWQARNEILGALLDALPANRMIQVRTPQIKQKYIYGPQASVSSASLEKAKTQPASSAFRIGFHNDCFLASVDDYGTYYDYGSTTQAKQPANEILRHYVEQDSKYVVVGGETCDDNYSPQNDCSPSGHAMEEMAAMHYSFLNTMYNNQVNNDWDSMGCIGSIRKKLGYRFTLQKGTFQKTANPGGSINFSLSINNEGFAALFNPRPVFLVLHNASRKSNVFVKCKTDPRSWFPGLSQIKEHLVLPKDLPKGTYQLFLQLPDDETDLQQIPAYCIRFANEDCWDNATGGNKLNMELIVK